MNTILTVVYRSHASTVFGSREARQQLKVHAQGENAKAGITGVLVYCEAVFFQAIEGPASAVDRLYGNILRDTRHHDIKLMTRTEIPKRAYGNWSMALIETDDTPQGLIPVDTRLAAIDQLLDKGRSVAVHPSRFIEVFINPAKFV